MTDIEAESQLNAYIKEYLTYKDLLETVQIFEDECRRTGNGISNVWHQDELVQLFLAGKRVEFFDLWCKCQLPYDLSSSDSTSQRMLFMIQLHFATFPFRSAKQVGSTAEEEALEEYRKFLESQGPDLGQSTEFMPYYALPYVSSPRTHPSFQDIFQEGWVEDLTLSLEQYLKERLPIGTPQLLKVFKDSETLGKESKTQMERLERRFMLQTQKLKRLQNDYQKVMSVTSELIGALESSVRGEPIDLDHIVSSYQRSFSGDYVTPRPSTRPGTPYNRIRPVSRANSHELEAADLERWNELDFDKIKIDLKEGNERNTLLLLQALRLKLTQSPNFELRRSFVDCCIKCDLFDLRSNHSYLFSFIGDSLFSRVQESTFRLLNAVSSIGAGRLYLSSSPGLLKAILEAIVALSPDNICLDMALATLHRLSFHHARTLQMLDSGVMEWVVSLLEDADALSDYSLEYATAFLMNLCLKRAGRTRSELIAHQLLRVLTGLLGSSITGITAHVNGALYSILSMPSIRETARSMGLEEMLHYLKREGSTETRRQLDFILKQLNKDSIPEEDVDSESEENDEEEEDENQEGMEAELDYGDCFIPETNELSGIAYLNANYGFSSFSAAGPRKTRTPPKGDLDATEIEPVHSNRTKSRANNSELLRDEEGTSFRGTPRTLGTPAYKEKINISDDMTDIDDEATEALKILTGRENPIAEGQSVEPPRPHAGIPVKNTDLGEYVVAFSSRPKIPRTPDLPGMSRMSRRSHFESPLPLEGSEEDEEEEIEEDLELEDNSARYRPPTRENSTSESSGMLDDFYMESVSLNHRPLVL